MDVSRRGVDVRIHGNPSGVRPTDKADEPERPTKAKSGAEARREDIVEISENARQLSSKLTNVAGDTDSAGGMGGTLARTMAEIRERIDSDFYDSEEILRRVASRILDLMDI
jgi:hypothetical protein